MFLQLKIQIIEQPLLFEFSIFFLNYLLTLFFFRKIAPAKKVSFQILN
ncbi:hypothetical protein CAPSP0001_0834 [Capnocytophaga sputigena ATCC 33612]|nr:hypothetical protein CAPSP0001_0834 [Capnocytophaga sputigena ATCC 33612]